MSLKFGGNVPLIHMPADKRKIESILHAIICVISVVILFRFSVVSLTLDRYQRGSW
jgi:hypothetical protein